MSKKLSFRKFFAVLGLICFMLISGVLAACEDTKLERLEIVSGLKDAYYVGEPAVDLEAVKLKVVYTDNTTKELTGASAGVEIFGSVNTEIAADYNIQFVYKEGNELVSVTKKVHVTPSAVTSIEYVSGLDATYYTSSTLDFSNLTIKLNRQNNTTGNVKYNATDFEIKEKVGDELRDLTTPLTVGEHTLSITYKPANKSVEHTITVQKVALASLEYVGETGEDGGFASAYYVGQELDFSDVKFKATYNDGSHKDLTGSDLTYTGNTEAAGETTFVFTYTEDTVERTVTIQLNVVEAQLSSIEYVSGIADSYFTSGSINLADVVVLQTYTYGDGLSYTQQANCTEGYKLYIDTTETSSFASIGAGTHTVKVVYGEPAESTINFTKSVEVVAVAAQSISYVSGLETQYELDSVIDYSKVTLRVNYNDGTHTEITSEFTHTEVSTATVGEQTIYFTYNDLSCFVKVNIVDNLATPTALAVKEGLAEKLYLGDELDLSEVKFTVTYNSDPFSAEVTFASGKIKVTEDDQEVASGTKLTAGAHTLKFEYTERTHTISVEKTITVYAPTSIAYTSGLQESYNNGDVISTSNVTATVTYGDSTTKVFTASDLTITGDGEGGAIRNTTGTEYKITIKYTVMGTTVETTFTYSVVAVPTSIFLTSGLESEYYYGELTFENIVITVVYNGKDPVTLKYSESKATITISNKNGGVEVQNPETLAVGQYTFNITYRDGQYNLSCTKDVEIKNKVTGLTVAGAEENKLTVAYGEGAVTSAVEKLTATASYLDNTNKSVTATAKYFTSNGNALSEAPTEIGKYVLKFTYEEDGVTVESEEITLIINGPVSIESLNGLTAKAGEQISLDSVTITVKNADDTTSSVNCTDQKVVITIDGTNANEYTATTGNHDVHVVYTFADGVELEFDDTLKVVAAESKTITSFSAPAFVTKFNATINAVAGDTTPYLDLSDKNYYVGDDNAFVMLPLVSALTVDGEPTILNQVYSKIKVELAEENPEHKVSGGEEYLYHELNDSEQDSKYKLSTYFKEVDGTNNTYKFADENAAVGKRFRLTVALDQEKYPDTTIFGSAKNSFTLEISVVDGWNAYKFADLSVIDNMTADNHGMNWIQYKKDHGYTVDGTPESAVIDNVTKVILHNDIKVVKEDLPDCYFWDRNKLLDMAKAKGGDAVQQFYDLEEAGVDFSLKDSNHLIERLVKPGETIEVIGNYFTIDSSKLPYVALLGSSGTEWQVGKIDCHTKILGFRYNEKADSTVKGVVKNVQFVGNAGKKAGLDTVSRAASGGVSGLEFYNVSSNISNVVVRNQYIGIFLSHNQVAGNFNTTDGTHPKGYMDTIEHHLSHINMSDIYNSGFYCYAAGKVYIDDSNFENFGGPVIISDTVTTAETSPSSNKEGFYQKVIKGEECAWSEFYVNNTKMESYVNGTETWFDQHSATSIASSISALSQILTGLSTQAAASSQKAAKKTWIVDNRDDFTYLDLKILFKGFGLSRAEGATNRGKFVLDGVTVTDLNVYADMEYAYTLQDAQAKVVAFDKLFKTYGYTGDAQGLGTAFTNDSGAFGQNTLAYLTQQNGAKAIENLKLYLYAKIGTKLGTPVIETGTKEATDSVSSMIFIPNGTSLSQGGTFGSLKTCVDTLVSKGVSALQPYQSLASFCPTVVTDTVYNKDAVAQTLLYAPDQNAYLGCMAAVLGYPNAQ